MDLLMISRKTLVLFLIATTTFSMSVTDSFARDLDKGDPDRAQILDAARQGNAMKFVVRDLFKDGDFAYLCALEIDQGQIVMTDDQIEVHKWGLKKQAKGWQAVELPGNFADSSTTVDCRVCDHAITSRSDIQSAISHAEQCPG